MEHILPHGNQSELDKNVAGSPADFLEVNYEKKFEKICNRLKNPDNWSRAKEENGDMDIGDLYCCCDVTAKEAEVISKFFGITYLRRRTTYFIYKPNPPTINKILSRILNPTP